MQSLTKRQQQILNYITRSIQKEGYPPSIREIGASLEIKSPRGVAGHLEALQRKGYIERERGARRIKVKRGSPVSPATLADEAARTIKIKSLNRPIAYGTFSESSPESLKSGDASKNVPILGAIAAGSPLLANEQIEDHLLVDERFASGKNIFALRVKGESMIGAGILNGDYVLVRQQPKVDDGEIAAVLLDDEATVKRVHCSKNLLRLVSENPAMKPIEVRENDKRIQILGKVVGVMRRIS